MPLTPRTYEIMNRPAASGGQNLLLILVVYLTISPRPKDALEGFSLNA